MLMTVVDNDTLHVVGSLDDVGDRGEARTRCGLTAAPMKLPSRLLGLDRDQLLQELWCPDCVFEVEVGSYL